MRKIEKLIAEYGESHQNKTNKLIHWLCVPSIFFSIVALVWCIPLWPLESLTIDGYNGLQFRIPIRPLVMPSPEKLKKLAAEAASEMEGILMDFSIEQYKDQVLINNFPLK